jgi:nucleotide-binding universal stress UspA family protein
VKILVAVDGSACSDTAVDEVGRRPWPEGTEVKVLTVVELLQVTPDNETWTLPPEYFEQWERAAEERGQAILARAMEKLRTNQKLKVNGESLKGQPKHVIVEEANHWRADLVVVGSHGYRGLKRLWLGSVSQVVASHAHCSVEIVRAREAQPGSDQP